MKHTALFIAISIGALPLWAATANQDEVQREVHRLQEQTLELQAKLNRLQQEVVKKDTTVTPKTNEKSVSKNSKRLVSDKKSKKGHIDFHNSALIVHRPDLADPESLDFYPTALVADDRVVTYIAGTPVVTSPYLGSLPAFNGSDYIVNISSINRDIRLMQQRRSLYRTYESIGYPAPERPILAISGKVEPVMAIGDPFMTRRTADLTLGSGELDVAAILNKSVEGYLSLAYDESPPDVGGQRLSNSSIDLNMGFVNIGNLDKTPLYFTGGQLYVPFGRFSSAMVSAPLPMILARTKSRPFILGYKSQQDSGPFAAIYGFRSDTTLGSTGAGGVNLGYIFDGEALTGEVGGSFISTVNDAGGMQFTGSSPGTTFGGFSSITNGTEDVKKIPAVGVHGSLSINGYNFIAEWVGATQPFRTQDLSFNGLGARPQAIQLEVGKTFIAFNKPASVALGYQWSKEALALNLPQQRIAGVFNISIWKDTVESLEYRHDMNYGPTQYANGASPTGVVNANTTGPGGASDTVLAQIGVYF